MFSTERLEMMSSSTPKPCTIGSCSWCNLQNVHWWKSVVLAQPWLIRSWRSKLVLEDVKVICDDWIVTNANLSQVEGCATVAKQNCFRLLETHDWSNRIFLDLMLNVSRCHHDIRGGATVNHHPPVHHPLDVCGWTSTELIFGFILVTNPVGNRSHIQADR
jgi:hypothetical protein